MARILIVHHDLTQIMLFKNVLRRQGYEVVSALNYASALETVQQNPIHLVFFSIWLRDISGLDLAHTLRTLDPTLPLVVLLSTFELHRSQLDALNVKSIVHPFESQKIVNTTKLYVRANFDTRV